MDKFLVQQKAKDSECEAQHILSQKTKRQKARTYDEGYVKLGFIACPSDVTKPQCVLCCKTLSNECMKPAKLKWHLMTQHLELTEKSQTFYERKKNNISSRKKL